VALIAGPDERVQEARRAATRRALDERTERLVHWSRFEGATPVYRVSSATDVDTAYEVRVNAREGSYWCSCPAGVHPACKHRTAVYLRRAKRAGQGLPPDGPNPGERQRVPDVSPARVLRRLEEEFSL
jgi:hypothetical protein